MSVPEWSTKGDKLFVVEVDKLFMMYDLLKSELGGCPNSLRSPSINSVSSSVFTKTAICSPTVFKLDFEKLIGVTQGRFSVST